MGRKSKLLDTDKGWVVVDEDTRKLYLCHLEEISIQDIDLELLPRMIDELLKRNSNEWIKEG